MWMGNEQRIWIGNSQNKKTKSPLNMCNFVKLTSNQGDTNLNNDEIPFHTLQIGKHFIVWQTKFWRGMMWENKALIFYWWGCKFLSTFREQLEDTHAMTQQSHSYKLCSETEVIKLFLSRDPITFLKIIQDPKELLFMWVISINGYIIRKYK